MTYFKNGYNLDAQQEKYNEQYENNRKIIRLINDENTPPYNFHKVSKGKNVKEFREKLPLGDLHISTGTRLNGHAGVASKRTLWKWKRVVSILNMVSIHTV